MSQKREMSQRKSKNFLGDNPRPAPKVGTFSVFCSYCSKRPSHCRRLKAQNIPQNAPSGLYFSKFSWGENPPRPSSWGHRAYGAGHWRALPAHVVSREGAQVEVPKNFRLFFIDQSHALNILCSSKLLTDCSSPSLG